MAVPFFENVSTSVFPISTLIFQRLFKKADEFCEDDDGSDFVHHPELPTKHNDLCGGRGTWDVIKENADFQGAAEGVESTAPETTFEVVTQSTSRYVVVMDLSTSMTNHDRLDKLKQGMSNWVKYEIRDGSNMALVTFKYDLSHFFLSEVVTVIFFPVPKQI